MSVAPKPIDRLQSTANIGIWLTTLVLILLAGVIGYTVWTALSDSDGAARFLSDQLDMAHPIPLLNVPQALLLVAVWLITDIIALAFLWQTRQLFKGIRARGIFTTDTARRLRRIGWLVFAIGPASVVLNLGCTMLMRYWQDPTRLGGSVAIEDADFYAMVVGLVIVAVGHIMVDATRLDAENRSFV